jgi:hypothetical protein
VSFFYNTKDVHYRFQGHRVQSMLLAEMNYWLPGTKNPTGAVINEREFYDHTLSTLHECGAVQLIDPRISIPSHFDLIWREKFEFNREGRSPIWYLYVENPRNYSMLKYAIPSFRKGRLVRSKGNSKKLDFSRAGDGGRAMSLLRVRTVFWNDL